MKYLSQTVTHNKVRSLSAQQCAQSCPCETNFLLQKFMLLMHVNITFDTLLQYKNKLHKPLKYSCNDYASGVIDIIDNLLCRSRSCHVNKSFDRPRLLRFVIHTEITVSEKLRYKSIFLVDATHVFYCPYILYGNYTHLLDTCINNRKTTVFRKTPGRKTDSVQIPPI